MKNLVTKIMVAGIVLAQIPSVLSAGLSDKAAFKLDSSAPSELRFQLRGQKSVTLYRTEYYESTCTRTESRTAYRTECTPIYREECYDTTREVCHESSREECSTHQVCRDVMREVCSSSGCHSYPTRECTNEESCRTVPDRECHDEPTRECRQVHAGDDCREVPYTEYYDVEYACTLSRQVPIGTEMTEDLLANILVRIEGDVSALGGQDAFEVSIANGLDVSRPDMDLHITNSADTHLFQLTKVAEAKKGVGNKQFEIQATYLLNVIPVADVLKERTQVTGISVSKTSMSFTTSGRKLGEGSAIQITIAKDKLVGGLKTIIDQTVALGSLKIVDTAVGQKASIAYSAMGESKLNGRPHEFYVKINTDYKKVVGGDVMNPAAIEKHSGEFISVKKVRVNL